MIRDSVIDWQELSDLYEQADGLDESALAAFLAGLREDGHRLLAPLERMLAARARIATGGFLESLPRFDPPEPQASGWAAGRRIGAYRLIRPIGAGGMAEVWLAERADGAFTRQVALKLLYDHPSRARRATFVERFQRERDILASLQHPNIAALHDAGVTDDGQPWLALEHVQGEPITAWCDAHGLDVAARVEVFRQVLLAVAHAHANLVIHRDLKPSNILVAAQGEVKLLDFGIAKLIEGEGQGGADSELTRQSGRPLTMMYASPEQVEGAALTTASDVYSAGVVLYELVARRRPYGTEEPSIARLQAAILSTEPTPPSRCTVPPENAAGTPALPRLGRAAATDLDAVVLKALAKEPARRYASAEAMRADLARWSEGRPVEAQAPSAAYRARRFVTRHRLGVALASAGLAALLVLTGTAIVLGLQARDESVRAIAAREFVQDLFRLADPDQSRGNEPSSRVTLAKGRANAEQVFAGQPKLLADVLATIGDMQLTIGDHGAADETLQRVAELYLSEGMTKQAAQTHADLADNAIHLGDFERAERLRAEATRLAQALPNDDQLHGNILFLRALGENARGRYHEAHALMLQARGRVDAWNAESERAVEVLQGLAEIEFNLGDRDAALARIDAADERAQRNPRIGPRVRVKTDVMRVKLQLEAGKYDAARQLLARLIPDCDRRLGAQTEECLVMRRRLVLASIRTGRVESAFEVSAQLLPALATASPRRAADTLLIVGESFALSGKSASNASIRSGLDTAAASTELGALYNSLALMTLSSMTLLEGDPSRAESLARRALEVQIAASVPEIRSARARMLLGMALHRQGRDGDAVAAFEGSNATFASVLGPRHPLTLLSRLNAVPALRRVGDEERVRSACGDAVVVLEPALGPDSPATQRIRELCAPTSVSATVEPVFL